MLMMIGILTYSFSVCTFPVT